MNLELLAGTPIWYWYYSGAAFVGFALTAIIATIMVQSTNWKTGGVIIKTIQCGAAVLALPLALANLGLNIAISNPELATIVSIASVSTSVSIATLYLCYRLTFGKVSKRKDSKQDNNPSTLTDDTNVFESTLDNTMYAGEYQNFDRRVAKDTVEIESPISIGIFGKNENNSHTIALSNQEFTIGRSSENDLVLDNPTISRNHARITREHGNYYIEDLRSTNGTLLNGESIRKTSITAGSSISLGEIDLHVTQTGELNMDTNHSIDQASPKSVDKTLVPQQQHVLGWLTMESPKGDGFVYQIKPGRNVIGRNENCDMRLNDPYVSRRHAILSTGKTGTYLSNIGEKNVIKVNDISLQQRKMRTGSVIEMGNTKLKLMNVEQHEDSRQPLGGGTLDLNASPSKSILIATAGPTSGMTYNLKEGENIIGRQLDSEVVLKDPTISNQHASLFCTENEIYLSDLGSTMGTKLDGKPVNGMTLTNGDVITVGKTKLTLTGAKNVNSKSSLITL